MVEDIYFTIILWTVKGSRKLNVIDLQGGNALSLKWLTFSLK